MAPPVDPQRLPLRGAVLDVTSATGRSRVTFRRLAGIYWLEDAHPQKAELLAALRKSRDTGEELSLVYAAGTMVITGLTPRA